MSEPSNVVPLQKPSLDLADAAPVAPPDANKAEKDSAFNSRWGERLSKPYMVVSRYFLQNYHRLKPEHPNARGLNSTEAMLILQILDHKWNDKAPFPAVSTLAKYMGLSPRGVRDSLKRLEDLGYVRREPSGIGGPNKYHFDGLYQALHKLQDEDVAVKDAAEVATNG